jgi:LPS export ABC transporter protein LptC
MTFGQVRAVKRVLLIMFLGSLGYVSYRVFHGVKARSNDSASDVSGTAKAVSREIEIEQLDSEGRTSWTLKAAESIAQTETSQQFRDVEIRFEAGDEKVPVLVTAERCEVHKDNSVYLEGNVVVRDDTSLRLEAETLRFQRAPDRIWTTDSVRYFRDGFEGDAGDMSYLLDSGLLELGNDVSMTLQNEGAAPVHVRSERASVNRELRLVQFVDTVRVRQSNRRLDSNDLQVYLNESNEEIERIEAYENVDFRMDVAADDVSERDSEAERPRASLTAEPGTKQLLTDRLEMFFRPGGEHLERARAMEGGRLVATLPEGARKGYHKDLESYTLAFDFDEEGRLTVLRGRGGVTLVLTPAAGDANAERKIVTARSLEADFDPMSGELLEARCDRSVTFEQGSVRAQSELGTFRALESVLVLEEEPRLWDEKANLEARRIRVNVDTGDLEGEGDVRSTSDRSGQSESGFGLFPTSGRDPVYFVSDHLQYDRTKDRAVYTGSARAIQGPNRIEANTIEILQAKGELSAEGRLRTVLLQKVAAPESPTEPTVTDAERLHYRSAANKLEYRGGVAMRSQEMRLTGESVDVTLKSGGGEVAEIFAEGDVDIETSTGKAGGDTAKYLPDDESLTVHGEKAWLESDGKLTEGKQLTFFTGNDKIFVDGREQTRTKTTYSSKPRL